MERQGEAGNADAFRRESQSLRVVGFEENSSQMIRKSKQEESDDAGKEESVTKCSPN